MTLSIEYAGTEPLQAYHVEVIAGGHVVRSFDAMAEDSCSVVMQHADLVEPGAKMNVMRLETWQALRASDERALADQMQRQGATS